MVVWFRRSASRRCGRRGRLTMRQHVSGQRVTACERGAAKRQRQVCLCGVGCAAVSYVVGVCGSHTVSGVDVRGCLWV